MSYWVVGSYIFNTAVTIDANKSAAHRARVQQEEQRNQIQQANLRAEMELAETARLQEKQLAAQRQMHAASLAQAEKAASESKALMDKQMKAADENMNRATQKRPNTARIVDEASQAGKSGASGTMLTGSQGVDPSTLTLGKNTLLGQ